MSDEPQQHDEGTTGPEPERPAAPPTGEGERSSGSPSGTGKKPSDTGSGAPAPGGKTTGATGAGGAPKPPQRPAKSSPAGPRPATNEERSFDAFAPRPRSGTSGGNRPAGTGPVGSGAARRPGGPAPERKAPESAAPGAKGAEPKGPAPKATEPESPLSKNPQSKNPQSKAPQPKGPAPRATGAEAAGAGPAAKVPGPGAAPAESRTAQNARDDRSKRDAPGAPGAGKAPGGQKGAATGAAAAAGAGSVGTGSGSAKRPTGASPASGRTTSGTGGTPGGPRKGAPRGPEETPAERTTQLGAVRRGGTGGAGGAGRPGGPGGPAGAGGSPEERPVERTTQLRLQKPGTPAKSGQGAVPPPRAADGTAVFAAADGPAGEPAGPGKKAKRKRPKRKGWRRLVPTWRFTLAAVLTVLLLGMGAFITGYMIVKIPAANAAATKQSNVYLYADGSQLARDGEVNRENVQLSQIPEDVRRTVLAAEDRDFYGQSAVDPKAMVRAGWNTMTGKGKQSGSTITQQYVKNYYLAQEQTFSRKAKEFFISIKLDREQSKDEILEGYLNTSFFGRNAYGIQSAAQAYYGVDVEKLTIEQGAYLASLLNAPSAYDVVAHPQNKPQVVSRWKYVLNGMVTEGWLSQEERDKMKFPMPREAKGSVGMSGQRGYLVQAVKDYLFEHDIISEDVLNAGGHRITTTLQKPKQDALVKAVNDQLMARVDKKARKVDRNVRAGGVSIDPATGQVVAMYGGIDYTKQFVNNATRRDFQVGSTFKPFVFTSGVENDSVTQDGRPITPNTVYDGTSKRPVEGWSGGPYAPGNQDYVNYGPITIREATDKSVNSVYAQMAVDVGPGKVEKTAVALGVPKKTPDMHPYPSIALGAARASVLDMTGAYATLANHGKQRDYTLVAKMTKNGAAIALPKRTAKQVVSRQAADTTTSLLRSVVDSGSGMAALAAERPAAGKTGTAENDKAAWFAGFTPDLATVIAVMGQDPVTGKQIPLYGALGEPRISGGGPPAQIWAQYTKAALKGGEPQDFTLRLQDGSNRRLDLPGASSSSDPDASTSPDTEEQETEGPTQKEEPEDTTPSNDATQDTERPTTPGSGATDGTTGNGQNGGTTGDGGTSAGTGGTTSGTNSGGTGGTGSGGTGGTGSGGTGSGGTGSGGTGGTGGADGGATGQVTGGPGQTGTPTGGNSPGLPTTP
ncbi:transglycosylase domain-containing protein [Streptomyces sp. NPDC059816]|uniref:transglycosylase domain-containing protein n=1 Tax=Streptomyces sp. NPDC059816 TaxID=3346960 RepID=UPI00365709F6